MGYRISFGFKTQHRLYWSRALGSLLPAHCSFFICRGSFGKDCEGAGTLSVPQGVLGYQHWSQQPSLKTALSSQAESQRLLAVK